VLTIRVAWENEAELSSAGDGNWGVCNVWIGLLDGFAFCGCV